MSRHGCYTKLGTRAASPSRYRATRPDSEHSSHPIFPRFLVDCRTRPAVVECSRPTYAGCPYTHKGSGLSVACNRTLSGTCHSYTQALGIYHVEELQLVGRETHECILPFDDEAGLVDFIVF